MHAGYMRGYPATLKIDAKHLLFFVFFLGTKDYALYLPGVVKSTISTVTKLKQQHSNEI